MKARSALVRIARGILRVPLIGLVILLEWIGIALMWHLRRSSPHEPTKCCTPQAAASDGA